MIDLNLGKALAFSLPIVCGMVCMALVLLDAYRCKRDRQEKRLRLFLALTYLVTSLGWLGLVLYSVAPLAFVYYHTLFLFTLMLDQVMFYRIVSVITDTDRRRPFKRLHLVIPLLLTFVYGGITKTIYGTTFEVIYVVIAIVFVIYNTLYPLLNLRNIRRYRRFVVNYSSEAQRISLDWLMAIQVLILLSVPVPLAGLLVNIEIFSSSYFVWFGALPTFMFYVMLCYNLLDDNYLIIQSDAADTNSSSRKTTVIDRKNFERYLREKEPYLNPKLRITDLATALGTNRSYLSTFINKEYGMNFCRFINRYRLDTLDRLRVSPNNADKSNMELLLMAGFSDYRNYQRVKKDEDKQSVLKVFDT